MRSHDGNEVRNESVCQKWWCHHKLRKNYKRLRSVVTSCKNSASTITRLCDSSPKLHLCNPIQSPVWPIKARFRLWYKRQKPCSTSLHISACWPWARKWPLATGLCPPNVLLWNIVTTLVSISGLKDIYNQLSMPQDLSLIQHPLLHLLHPRFSPPLSSNNKQSPKSRKEHW